MTSRHITRVTASVDQDTSLTGGEGLDRNLRLIPVAHASRSERKQDPVAAWQPLWALCQLALLHFDQGDRWAPACGNLPDACGSLSNENRVVDVPQGAPGVGRSTQRHRRPAAQRYLLQGVSGPEPQPLAVGREKRASPAADFRTSNRGGGRFIQRA